MEKMPDVQVQIRLPAHFYSESDRKKPYLSVILFGISDLAMNCPNCGKENQDGQKFCGNCGSRIDGVAAPRPLTMRLLYTRQWMWSFLLSGVTALIASVGFAVIANEPIIAVLIAIYGLISLPIGIWLLRKYGTGLNE